VPPYKGLETIASDRQARPTGFISEQFLSAFGHSRGTTTDTSIPQINTGLALFDTPVQSY